MILTQTEWEGIPADRKRIKGHSTQAQVQRIEQGRWAKRWVLVAILPDRQVRELSALAA